jgi:hypothetical protein
MILALAATHVTMGIPEPSVVNPGLRTSAATLPDAHDISSGSATSQMPPVVSASMKKHSTALALAAQGSTSKRLPSETSQGQVPAAPLTKKRKVIGFSSPAVSSSVAGGSTGTCIYSSAPTGLLIPPAVPVPPVSSGLSLSPELAGTRRLVRTQTIGTSGKRFKPPKIMRPTAAMSGDVENAQMLVLHGEQGPRTEAQLTAIGYLDFSAPMVPPALSPISLPPSLAERRLVQRWAIIVGGLSEKERYQCCFVSKLIRYAGKRCLPRSLGYMHSQPRQSTHRPTISFANTSLGSVYPLCCSSMAQLHL